MQKPAGPQFAYLLGTMHTKRIKNFIYKTSLRKLGVLLFLLTFYSAPTLADLGENRSLKLWDQPIEYQFSIKQDLKVNYDGEAFMKQVDGKKVNFVILNKAFFEKEAKKLFDKFAQIKNPNGLEYSFSNQEISALEKKLKSAQFGEGAGEEVKATILKLQNALEYTAWYKIYQQSLEENQSREEAKSHFADLFSRVRMKTIEYHEVSHLVDLKKSEDHQSNDFAKFTELNAFYTELAYGENPWDVMSQAMIGVLDEVNQKQPIDYSVEKVFSAVQLLKKNSSLMKKVSLQKAGANGALQNLTKLNKSDYSFIGHTLHQNSYRLFTSLTKSAQK